MTQDFNRTEAIGAFRYGRNNFIAQRREAIFAGDLLRRRSIRIDRLHPDVWPKPPTSPKEPVGPPEYHPDPRKDQHERGGGSPPPGEAAPAPTSVARGDHNHQFSYPSRIETRATTTADPGWEDKQIDAGAVAVENATDPWQRRVWWQLLGDDPETRTPSTQVQDGPQFVFVEYSSDGGTTWSEPELAAIAGPKERTAYFIANRSFNFDEAAGAVATVRVTVLLGNNPQDGRLKLVRTGRDGKIASSWLGDLLVYALLGGRAGGQALKGGTGASENLDLYGTAHATPGRVRAMDPFETRSEWIQRVVSPTTITSNVDDWNDATLAQGSVVVIVTDASREIRGMTGGVEGKVRTLYNGGTFPAVLVNESGTSTAGNRFSLPADLTLAAKEGCIVVYRGSRWCRVG